MHTRLWYGMRSLFEFLKAAVGLMVVPRPERLVRASKGESACRNLMMQKIYVHVWVTSTLIHLTGCVCHSGLWLWWKRVQRAITADNVRMFFWHQTTCASVGRFWILFLENPLWLHVVNEMILVPVPPRPHTLATAVNAVWCVFSVTGSVETWTEADGPMTWNKLRLDFTGELGSRVRHQWAQVVSEEGGGVHGC